MWWDKLENSGHSDYSYQLEHAVGATRELSWEWHGIYTVGSLWLLCKEGLEKVEVGVGHSNG